MHTLYVIIVTYQPVSGLSQLLQDIENQSSTLGYHLHILIVHNGRSPSWVSDAIKTAKSTVSITLLHDKKNRGFAGGCNRGLFYLKPGAQDIVLFLNPDTHLRPACLPPLVHAYPDIAAPIVAFRRQKHWVYDCGGRIIWWLGRSFHNEAAIVHQKQNPWKNKPSDYVSGCCMRIRGSVIQAIGGFDERYFLYFEDVDFCLRARQAGFTIGLVQNAIIEHDLQEDAAKSHAKHLYLLNSNWQFISTWIPWWSKPLAVIYWLALLVRIALIRGEDGV